MATFSAASPSIIRADIAALSGTTADAVERHLQGMSDELLFHILTTPALRQHFTHLTDLPTVTGQATGLQMGDEFSAAMAERLRTALLCSPLSTHLRRQIQ